MRSRPILSNGGTERRRDGERGRAKLADPDQSWLDLAVWICFHDRGDFVEIPNACRWVLKANWPRKAAFIPEFPNACRWVSG